jgi:putative ubiquitin-RnfH superfamily antitoxin RatB of RatAB toxin-antitoxin module
MGIRAGIFGRRAALDVPLGDGDRVEIYRALKADPKEIRRRRASNKTAKR